MRQAAPDVPRMRRDMAAIYGPVQAELSQVDEILRHELRSRYDFVDQLVKHAFRLGGKRLRPALLLLSARACGRMSPEHLTLAAVVEMIHTATLVHDDVLDEAAVRRHLETVNARWNNEASVLLGDYLFTHAFYLASTLDTTFACQTIGRATNTVCEGELRQVHSRGNFDLSEEEYLSLIEAKTAELCACCCLLGAHYAGASEEIQQGLERFGRHLGIAFQITDDLLDLLGDEATTGKSLGTDLEKQKPTLPVIRCLEQLGSADRTTVLDLLETDPGERPQGLRPWLERTDALLYTRERARGYVRQALAELSVVKASPAQQVLTNLAEFVINRQL